MLTLSNSSSISPLQEIIAYETLWSEKETSFKSLAELFAANPGARPSDFIDQGRKINLFQDIRDFILKANKDFKTNFLINGTYDFPSVLKDAKEPVELLYYTGNLDILSTRCIAIVGTRNPTLAGLKTTETITRLLIRDDFTIVSGLAAGIDTQAHTSAIQAKGRTIAVIGTPLNKVYPKQNADLQNKIAKEYLLISQVPFYRYSQQDYRYNRLFFLERNKTMSALTEATIIVEAGDTSGSLTQARAALFQKRKVLICEACFENKSISWPKKFLDQGAIRVKTYTDIKRALQSDAHPYN